MLTPEKRALVKFIVVAGARGPIRGGSKPDTLFPPRIVKIADLYVAFIAAPLVTSVKSNLFRRTRQSLLHASSPLSLFAVTNFSKNFALGRPITDADPLRGGRSSFETHGEQTGSKEKDFYPTGGPRGFSTARRAVSSASSVRLPGPGTLENVYRAPAWNNIHRIFEGTACG